MRESSVKLTSSSVLIVGLLLLTAACSSKSQFSNGASASQSSTTSSSSSSLASNSCNPSLFRPLDATNRGVGWGVDVSSFRQLDITVRCFSAASLGSDSKGDPTFHVIGVGLPLYTMDGDLKSFDLTFTMTGFSLDQQKWLLHIASEGMMQPGMHLVALPQDISSLYNAYIKNGSGPSTAGIGIIAGNPSYLGHDASGNPWPAAMANSDAW